MAAFGQKGIARSVDLERSRRWWCFAWGSWMLHVGDPAKGGFLSGDFRYYEASEPKSFDTT